MGRDAGLSVVEEEDVEVEMICRTAEKKHEKMLKGINSKHSKHSNRLQYIYIENNSKHSKQALRLQ